MTPRFNTRSLATRLILGSAVWIVAALVVGGLLLAGLFQGHVQRIFDDRQVIMLDSLIVVTRVDARGALELTRPPGDPEFERPLSGRYWQITPPSGAPLRSRSLWDQTLKLPEASAARTGVRRSIMRGPQDEELRVLERDITLPGSDKIFRYAVAIDYAEVEGLVQPLVVTLAWSLGVLGIGLVIGAMVQVRYGLRPLSHVREALSAIRTGQTERLEGDFPTEVTPLADEINLLLDHITQVVDRARTHVGNLAHALKTPLTVLTNEAGTDNSQLASTVRRQTDTMRRRVDHYLTRAQTAATAGVIGARIDARPVLDDLSRTLGKINRFRHLEIDVVANGEIPSFRGDRQDLEEMAGNLMENACKWATSRMRVIADGVNGELRLAIEDDGPGLRSDQRDQALARGGRLDETVQGSGLGLSIVQEIASLYGGSFALEDSAMGGLRAVLTLPAAPMEVSRAAAK
jgi:signal transduction histidine kinase